jgi:hypothetical protein
MPTALSPAPAASAPLIVMVASSPMVISDVGTDPSEPLPLPLNRPTAMSS